MADYLLVLTTAGRLKWLREAIATLRAPLEELDVLVIDDGSSSEVGIEAFCKEKGLKLITKPKAFGVTDSWNRAYTFFKQKGYKACIISNDDVRFPQDCWRGLAWGVYKRGYHLLVPLSNAPGDGKGQRIQRFLKIKPNAKNADQIQEALFKRYHGKKKWASCGYFNGFCFAFGSSIEKFKFSKKFLFDPKRKNRGNEIDLVKRMKVHNGRIGISMISYVFHWKYGTYRYLKLKHKDQNWR